ncbi:NUDIX domain-containing protein [Candidatus Gottesmanbacteria bacterium]|nr:NUDIX domain-containing protein [Candidatus Gottesmanbacteria bacterium]
MDNQPIGVCVITINKDKKILLGKRKNSYKAGMYGLPGGRLDLNESLVGCVERELLEETGLAGQNFKYIGVVREKQQGYNFIHFAFSCNDFKGEPKVVEKEKCESWDWYSLDNLPKEILPGHKAAIDIFINPLSSFAELL